MNFFCVAFVFVVSFVIVTAVDALVRVVVSE